jgi:hypothetical protein
MLGAKMARHESAMLGDFADDSKATWTTKDEELPFAVRDSFGNEIKLRPREARDLAAFLVRWLYEYIDV